MKTKFEFHRTICQEQYLYYTTEVEADTLQEAIKIAEDSTMIDWDYNGDDNGVTLKEDIELTDGGNYTNIENLKTK